MPNTITLQDSFQFISDNITGEDGSFSDDIKVRFINYNLRRLRRKFDVPSSEQVTQMKVYSDEFYYNSPSPYLKQVSRLYSNYNVPDLSDFNPVSDDLFFRDTRVSNLLSFTKEGIDPYVLINLKTPLTPIAQINNCESLTGAGTWSAVSGTDASNIGVNYLYFRNGSASISFDIDVSASANNYAEVQCINMPAVNLSENTFFTIADFFLWLYLPNSTNFTSFTARFGSSASDYYEMTVTAPFAGSSWKQGWNRLSFDWETATTVGSPDASQISYFRLRATYPSTMTDQVGLCIDSIQAKTPRLFNLHWMTDALVIDGTTELPKLEFDGVEDTDSTYAIDDDWVDYIHFAVLQQAFTSYISDQDAREENKMHMKELEDALQERFPSPRQPEVGEWMETDDLQPLLN